MKKNLGEISMKHKIIMIIVTVIILMMLSLLIFPKALYKPLSKESIFEFVFDYENHQTQLSYEEQNALFKMKHLESDYHIVIDIIFFDKVILEMLSADLQKLNDAIKNINYHSLSDLNIIEHEEELEIIIHARFDERLFYQKKQIFVSKYFNLIIPFTGKVSFSDLGPAVHFMFLQGFIDGSAALTDIGYDSPVSMHYIITKEIVDVKPDYFDMKYINFYTTDFNVEDPDLTKIGEFIVIKES